MDADHSLHYTGLGRISLTRNQLDQTVLGHQKQDAITFPSTIRKCLSLLVNQYLCIKSFPSFINI